LAREALRRVYDLPVVWKGRRYVNWVTTGSAIEIRRREGGWPGGCRGSRAWIARDGCEEDQSGRDRGGGTTGGPQGVRGLLR
jgi:hypothetical protein